MEQKKRSLIQRFHSLRWSHKTIIILGLLIFCSNSLVLTLVCRAATGSLRQEAYEQLQGQLSIALSTVSSSMDDITGLMVNLSTGSLAKFAWADEKSGYDLQTLNGANEALRTLVRASNWVDYAALLRVDSTTYLYSGTVIADSEIRQILLHHYYVSADAEREGCGSQADPFRTISAAAAAAKAGDEVIVAAGVYRESVDPRRGGTGEDNRIVYRSEEPGKAVITGAEQVKGWRPYQGDVWTVRIPNGIFNGYNPYTTFVRGDWYMTADPVHTGEIYLNGKAMYESTALDGVLQPEIYRASWDPGFTKHKWYTEQDGDVTVLYANFQGADPNVENVEINVRRNCFYPSREGVGYITLSGFVIRQAATQWAPPTAYQEGMVGPHWSKGWIIEDCEISDSRCSGISLGKYLQPNNENKWSTQYFKDGTQTERDAICQAQLEGWTKENIGSHIIRRCNIHDCGQTGIVGHLGGVFSVIEDNHIHHINNKQDLAGAEIGGIKMHAAIDVVYRRNHIHHCTRGLWLDWQAQGTRVTQNVFHDNTPPEGTEILNTLALGEDIFVEVSRLSTQGLAFVHNLIAGSFTWVGQGTDNCGEKFPTPRYTPYHVPHRTEVAGFMTILHGDARFYNNIFVQKPVRADLLDYASRTDTSRLDQIQFLCGTKPYDGYPAAEEYFSRFSAANALDGTSRDVYYDHLPVYTGGNVYFNGAQPCSSEQRAFVDTEHTVTWELKEEDGVCRFVTDLYRWLPDGENQTISTELLGRAFEPEQRFEQPDGRPIVFDQDYFGAHRGLLPLSGPFAGREDNVCISKA